MTGWAQALNKSVSESVKENTRRRGAVALYAPSNSLKDAGFSTGAEDRADSPIQESGYNMLTPALNNCRFPSCAVRRITARQSSDGRPTGIAATLHPR